MAEVDEETLRGQVDTLSEEQQEIVAKRIAEIAEAKKPKEEPAADFANMPENEFRQILHKYT